MKQLITAAIVLFCSLQTLAQQLYVKTFGSQKDPAIIFLHGGPGYNAANFEATTAKRLADTGFFVIVYDRRGEGRSEDKQAKYTFKQSIDDINSIRQQFGLKKVTLVGHSFGGMLGVMYAKSQPEAVNALVLVGAPVSLQESFKTIISNCRAVYQAQNDTTNLRYLSWASRFDSSSMAYASYCFIHAMKGGLYTAGNLSPEAKALYAAFKQDPLGGYGNKMNTEAPNGFSESEHYTTMDLGPAIQELKIPVYALYGKEDGLYSKAQVDELSRMLGEGRLHYLDNCSHNVFIDRQDYFIAQLKSWVK